MKTIYMDHNATTPTDARVLEAMLPYFTERFGNPSSPHGLAHGPRRAVDTARDTVAGVLGCAPEDVVFTGCGSESDNMAIQGVAAQCGEARGHIVTSAIEHHAVLRTCEHLETRGFEVTYVEVGADGLVRVADIEAALRADTRLITIMHANNEVGTVQPVGEIGAIARARGIVFHTDAVQSVGKIPVDVDALNVDLLSLSAHKFYGPKGVGALYVRPGTRLRALAYGGQQERGMRPGTENVPGIVGLAEALTIAVDELVDSMPRLDGLVGKLTAGVRERVKNVIVNGDEEHRVPGTVNLSFPGIEGESIVLALDMEGVAVSTGSACTTDAAGPSHVLRAMGIAPNVAQGSVRFGLGRRTCDEDIELVLAVLPGIVERLRAMSPFSNSYR
ncbi:cysteine desulfurase [bacterium]|nr:cysteine desulfurase [bacterium]